MTSVIFVHGTGVRALAYERSFNRISSELLTRRPDLQVKRCLWGEERGATLQAHGASIPLYDTTRGLESLEIEDYEMALWSLLYQNPLYELWILSLKAKETANVVSGTDFVFGQASPIEELDEKVREFFPSPNLYIKLQEMGIAEFFPEAKVTLIDSTTYADLLQTLSTPLSQYRAAIARAIVALAINIGEQKTTSLLPDALLRDEIVSLLTIELGDSERALVEDIAKVVMGNPFTHYLRHWRGKYTDAVYPFAGDILLYQARGEPIRDCISECIERTARDASPVVLLAHSLGGIACVDLLVQREVVRQQIQLLITVGTQAPFLYEIGALQSLPFGFPLPDPFPRWINIYDHNDFLSYAAAGVFPTGVKDILVNNRQPFPQAHAAYWTNKNMWEKIIQWLP